jgi:hypothetical protein
MFLIKQLNLFDKDASLRQTTGDRIGRNSEVQRKLIFIEQFPHTVVLLFSIQDAV